MRRYLVWLISGVLLSTPIQAQVSLGFRGKPPFPPETSQPVDYSKIKTVAVLSGIGSTVTVQKQGLVGYKRTEFAINDWGIDSFVVSRVREYLGDRFIFRDAPYDVRAMGRLPATVLRDTNKTVRAFFNTVPKDVDAYIVVRRQSILRVWKSERSAPGLAFYDLAFSDNAKRTDATGVPTIVTNYAIDVLDPKRLDVIATANAQMRYRTDGQPYFAELIGGADLKTSDAVLSEAQRESLRPEFERLLSISLPDTLRALDFGVPLPPPAAGTHRIVPFAAGEDPFANIRRISVLSAIGDRFHFGDESTNNADLRRSLPIADWDVDAHVEEVARRVLSQRFEVKGATVDRAALLTSTVRDGSLNFTPMVRGMEPTVDVDAYVLFLKFPMPLGFGGYEALGLGLFNYEEARSQPKVNALFAHYAVVVIDARSLKVIRAISGTMSPDDVAPRATRKIDSSLWAASVAQLTDDQEQGIKQSLLELLTKSTEQTLLRIGLTGQAVVYPPGIRPEECWPLPSNVGQAAALGAMTGAAGFGFLGAYAATLPSGGTAMGRVPMLFDEKGLVC